MQGRDVTTSLQLVPPFAPAPSGSRSLNGFDGKEMHQTDLKKYATPFERRPVLEARDARCTLQSVATFSVKSGASMGSAGTNLDVSSMIEKRWWTGIYKRRGASLPPTIGAI